MVLLNIRKQILTLQLDFIKEIVSKEELIDYTEDMLSKDIDGELIRSYFIVYKDGINIVWNKLVDIDEDYKNEEITDIERVEIEEALEKIDFDKLFFEEIEDIKNAKII